MTEEGGSEGLRGCGLSRSQQPEDKQETQEWGEPVRVSNEKYWGGDRGTKQGRARPKGPRHLTPHWRPAVTLSVCVCVTVSACVCD